MRHKHGVRRLLHATVRTSVVPACAQPDVMPLWFSNFPAERRLAAELCVGCPVLVLCLAAAVEGRETDGVWGGVDFTRPTRQRRYPQEAVSASVAPVATRTSPGPPEPVNG